MNRSNFDLMLSAKTNMRLAATFDAGRLSPETQVALVETVKKLPYDSKESSTDTFILTLVRLVQGLTIVRDARGIFTVHAWDY